MPDTLLDEADYANQQPFDRGLLRTCAMSARLCPHCHKPLTACWSKGRSKRYPYYLCDTKGCKAYRKSIRKEKVEGEFEVLLACMVPAKELFRLVFEMMRDQWDDRTNSTQESFKHIRRELASLERKAEGLVDRIVDTDTSSLVSAYEKRLKDLELQKIVLEGKLTDYDRPAGSFEEIYRTAFLFLANPLNLWHSEHLEDRRAVLKMVFAEPLSYLKNQGYRTAETTLPFKALADFSEGNLGMVELDGIEPTTSCMPCKRSPN